MKLASSLAVLLLGMGLFTACRGDDEETEPKPEFRFNGMGGIPSDPDACDDNHFLWEEEPAESRGGAGGSLAMEPARTLTDLYSGLVQCGTGRINRPTSASCGDPLSFVQPDSCDGFSAGYEEICEGFDYTTWEEQGDAACETPGCIVQAGCTFDYDCAQDEACVCASARQLGDQLIVAQTVSRCVPASCTYDSQCPSGECGAIIGDCGYDVIGFACRTDDDECKNDDDCEGTGNRCGYDEDDERWVCSDYAECE